MKEITSITASKKYFIDNTFELYITIVVAHFWVITKRQSTEQEQLHKVAHKNCDHTKRLSATHASALTIQPPPSLPLPQKFF
jgi:hypothetical protein